ncbi:MAG: hypothetical protein HOW73_43480 [Polyangiaceae bacterium]|nr:hypothetical protein [Polyangiaceae bacterium]
MADELPAPRPNGVIASEIFGRLLLHYGGELPLDKGELAVCFVAFLTLVEEETRKDERSLVIGWFARAMRDEAHPWPLLRQLRDDIVAGRHERVAEVDRALFDIITGEKPNG